ncbi:glycosyl transferase [Paractinoplanes abujensis]|uniref:4-amino-4-deoxy-L-arabinose transferase-like glycosyltransferase n=1 Tax=Paractinoplanes abujensis TaxID=882441 RepID=A0A7W7CZQ3_9ACTN|nr:glycosyltransferase family 39 protein [Actinoplanes abujensis]MBB4697576.1 4-amino-4-deoxy-L-arabinose transferase-like glycosyltransferase [Actinoplanes abujensis]GID19934.1 glycosyl transferase [Actinoplanes abujensis]
MLLRRWLYPLAVVLLLGQMALAMVTTAVQQSPTIDEPVYVATAQFYLDQHQVLYNPEHPPLAKLFMAAGLAFTGAALDPAYRGNQTNLGRHLLYESGHNPFELMLAARLPIIVLTLLFGLAVLFFARDLAGRWAGLIALSLYAFSPDIIAHGSLATLDVPAAGFVLVTFWMLWRAREHPRRYLPLAGLALGAALATRMSTLPAVPMALLLVLLAPAVVNPGPIRAWRELGKRVLAAIGVGLIAVAVVWLVYLIVDPRLRWTTPAWLDPSGLKAQVVDLLPLPPSYRDGILIQFRLEQKVTNGFLLGEAYKGSLWYYLPVALLIKTPIGMLLLWLAGTVTLLIKKWVAALYLLVPAGVLMLVAMTGSRNYGTRYVIFMPMMLAVVAGTVVLIRWRWAWVPATALAGFVAVSALLTFPYYLPYSNEAFGGTARTHENLHDSNVDWGQDLPRLSRHLKEKYPGQPVWLVYKGAGVPAYYDIEGRNPLTVPIDEVRGLLVVSDSRVALARNRLKQLIDSSTEIDQVGYSFTIYRR